MKIISHISSMNDSWTYLRHYCPPVITQFALGLPCVVDVSNVHDGPIVVTVCSPLPTPWPALHSTLLPATVSRLRQKQLSVNFIQSDLWPKTFKTSLKSLRLRKLLDLSYSAGSTWPHLTSLGLSGPLWALLGLTGPYFALLGLHGHHRALLGILMGFFEFANGLTITT